MKHALPSPTPSPAWSDRRKSFLRCALNCAELRAASRSEDAEKAVYILRLWVDSKASLQEAQDAALFLESAYGGQGGILHDGAIGDNAAAAAAARVAYSTEVNCFAAVMYNPIASGGRAAEAVVTQHRLSQQA